MMKKLFLLFFAFTMTACSNSSTLSLQDQIKDFDQRGDLESITLAGGCFWCIEGNLQKREGVVEAIPGYTGGKTDNPTYEEVSTGTTGHYEAVKLWYDPQITSLEKLLDIFWLIIDPTDDGGQFSDRGSQYRTAIFYNTPQQKDIAEKSKAELEASKKYDKPIVTEILPTKEFYPAEEYHQNYKENNPLRYELYEEGSGRAEFIRRNKAQQSSPASHSQKTMETFQNFKKPSPEELQEKLTPLQYSVTQEEGTERPFDNEYWDNKKEGIYVDRVSGEPLFSSTDKFESGTGWPSFTKPIDPQFIETEEDHKLLMSRTEVRSKYGDSHLGHVFPDGPKPTGQRYCMNSAALRFIPRDKMEEEGYGEYLPLFQ